MPTEANPDFGCVAIRGVLLSAAKRWIDLEDGAHVIASTEFDIYGQGADWSEALEDLLHHAREYVFMLADLGESRTENEEQAVRTLGPRLVRFLDEWRRDLEEERERLAAEIIRRRRRMAILFTTKSALHHRYDRAAVSTWQSGHRQISSQLSHA